MTEPSDDESLSRPQRRLLRRLFNGRTAPVAIDGRLLLTYQDASRYLLALAGETREAAYREIRKNAER